MQNTNSIKSYIVIAKCGHVGRSFYVEKEFPIRASSLSEAANLVRYMPRVKHHRKDAILSVREVDEEEYREALGKQNADPFFRCKNKQDQNLLCPELCLETKRDDTDANDESHWLHRQCKRLFRAKKERWERREYSSYCFA